MPTSQTPGEETEPKGPADPAPEAESSAPEKTAPGGFLGLPLNPKGPLETNGSAPSALRGSRWVDYDTHELLEMIGELEDERRSSRLREGFWLALLAHILFFSAITWIPTYIFKVPKVIDPFDAINKRKDDVVIGISGSGNSPNVLKAFYVARAGRHLDLSVGQRRRQGADGRRHLRRGAVRQNGPDRGRHRLSTMRWPTN